MTTHIHARATPTQQDAAIKLSKTDMFQLTDDELDDAEIAVAVMSEHWGKTEDWVRRWLAATFLILLSFAGGFDLTSSSNQHQDQDRVFARVSRIKTKREV